MEHQWKKSLVKWSSRGLVTERTCDPGSGTSQLDGIQSLDGSFKINANSLIDATSNKTFDS